MHTSAKFKGRAKKRLPCYYFHDNIGIHSRGGEYLPTKPLLAKHSSTKNRQPPTTPLIHPLTYFNAARFSVLFIGFILLHLKFLFIHIEIGVHLLGSYNAFKNSTSSFFQQWPHFASQHVLFSCLLFAHILTKHYFAFQVKFVLRKQKSVYK